jgi:hypothetical protein
MNQRLRAPKGWPAIRNSSFSGIFMETQRNVRIKRIELIRLDLDISEFLEHRPDPWLFLTQDND